MATTGFVDLPTELVLKIVHDTVLTQQDLYSLAILSRKLNMIVMPILLELLGVSNPQDTIRLILDSKSFPLSRPRLGLLRARHSFPVRPILDSSDEDSEKDAEEHVRPEAAIMVAFQITSIQRIMCTFPQTFTDLTNLNLHLSRLHALLSHLKSVNSITFHFTGDDRYRHLKSNPLSAVPVTFADIFGDIIKSLVSKGCENILLYNKSEQFQNQYRSLLTGAERPALELHRPAGPTTELGPPLVPSQKRKKNIFSRAKANIETALFSNRPASPSKHKSHSHTANGQNSLYPAFNPGLIQPGSGKLQAIHIQTPFALLPRCLPVIRDSIHSSINTLTSVTLSYIFFDEHLFDSCLSSLFFDQQNAVTHLYILHCHNISPKSLLSFLKCFQARLEHMELDWDTAFIRNDEDIPGGVHFQKLKTIIAPLDWVAYLLRQPKDTSSNMTGTTPLPNLSAMTVQCRLPDALEFTYKAFSPHLDNILQPIYSRTFDSSFHTKRHPQIDITLSLILDRNRPFQLDLDTVIMNFTLKSLPPASSSNNCDETSSGPRPPIHWDLISKLELSPTYPPVTENQAFSLSQWVTTVFPAVAQVTLPLPFIPRLMSIERYKSRQKDLTVDAAVFLKDALRLRQMNNGSTPLAWKTLVVGPWTLSLEED